MSKLAANGQGANVAEPLTPAQEETLRTELRVGEKGRLWWTVPKRGRQMNKPVGCPDGRGYLRFYADGRQYLAHRVVLFLSTGNWPTFAVDHVDGNVANNSPANLRPADFSQSSMNRGEDRRNSSGAKGVSWCRRRGAWRATIGARRKQKHLGYFADKDAAASAYAEAASQMFGEFARRNGQ